MLKISAKAIIAKHLTNKIRFNELREQDLAPLLREIRISLLNSDVNLQVVKAFLDEVRGDLLGTHLGTGDTDLAVFSTIKEKLTTVLGSSRRDLTFSRGVDRYLIVGVNGGGKTTTTVKLAHYIKTRCNKSVATACLDIHRPGAYEQLEQLSTRAGVDSSYVGEGDLREYVRDRVIWAEEKGVDVLLFDSFGLLRDNGQLVSEIEAIHRAIRPTEVLFVLDAQSGQDFLETIRFFHEKLSLTGLIISKADSNAPMGAAFSASYLLNVPIKFLGEGEDIKDLTVFHPQRIAGRILGEGDVFSLVEKMEDTSAAITGKKFMDRLMRGNFDLEDLISQIKEVKKMGSLRSIVKFLPGFSQLEQRLPFSDMEDQLRIWEILISSMTMKERRNPKLFKKNPNRKIRVIRGSGRKADELNKLLKKWEDSKRKMEELTTSFRRGNNPFNFLMGN